MKKSRFELSYLEMIRRSLYAFLRDELERRLKIITFDKIYKQCRDQCIAYPYVDPREMRPKKREFAKESSLTLPYIIIFCEESINAAHQKYIRFSDDNRIRKDTLALIPGIQLNKPFYSGIKFFERNTFFDLLETVLDVDYGLLIQRDDRYRKQNRYALSHFHVKIDWPIAEAAESLGKEMRYISKNLYEKGERLAGLLQEKLFEYYGWHHQATGGRRTAALIAAQYLKQIPGLTTVYVSSSETRTLTRYSEKGVVRYAMPLFSLIRIMPIRSLRLTRSPRRPSGSAMCWVNPRASTMSCSLSVINILNGACRPWTVNSGSSNRISVGWPLTVK
jgi:hypothetical protein